jgi:hypothetical protein
MKNYMVYMHSPMLHKNLKVIVEAENAESAKFAAESYYHGKVIELFLIKNKVIK